MTLVEGPWVHGGWARNDGDHLGDVQFNAKTSLYFRANIQFPFFEHYLKGGGKTLPTAIVFETGTNVWRRYDEWPPKNAVAKTLYFHAGGKLSFDPPVEAASADEYLSDPNHPVPFVGYTTDTVPQRYMVDDQRFAGYRPDVLVYETDPLTEDVTIAGPISPHLKVASSGTDSDFDVKLIDVYPDEDPANVSMPNKRVIDEAPVHMGGYRGVAARRAVPRKIPRELGKAGAACARQGNRYRLHHARSLSHIPSRSPHHGSGAELVVSAHRPQPANLYRHSLRQAGGFSKGHRAGVSPKGRSFRRGSVGVAATITAGATRRSANQRGPYEPFELDQQFLISALLFATVAPMCAEEGMWTFDNPPLKALAEKYNFHPTQEWFDHLRLSSVRLNDGGSGSFVSPNGLLLTNHHVARFQLQKNSTAGSQLRA